MILDDDHGGIFGFEDSEAEIVESVGVYELKVQRVSGARGKVAIPYNTEDGSAKAGVHFEAVEGELLFENEETEKSIELPITDEEKIALLGRPCLGTNTKIQIRIRESMEFKNS